MTRVIVVSSGKGGVGKTTTALNLAAALNAFGKNVVVVDANLTTPNIGVHLGAPNVPVSLTHVLSGKARVHEAIYEHHSGMKVMPSSLSLTHLRSVKPERLIEVAKKLKRVADISVFDSAAGLGKEAIIAIQSGDEVLITTQAEMPALADALKVIKAAEDLGKSVTGVVVTRFRQHRYELPLEDVQAMLEKPIIAIIPEDESVKEALRLRDTVVHTHPKSPAAESYKELAARLIGRHYVAEVEVKEKRGKIARLLKSLGLAK